MDFRYMRNHSLFNVFVCVVCCVLCICPYHRARCFFFLLFVGFRWVFGQMLKYYKYIIRRSYTATVYIYCIRNVFNVYYTTCDIKLAGPISHHLHTIDSYDLKFLMEMLYSPKWVIRVCVKVEELASHQILLDNKIFHLFG